MRQIYTLLLSVLLLTTAAQAAPKSEAEVHAYRETMSEVGKALQDGEAQIAFQKVKPLAEQGYPEAQYILGTLYAGGEGTETNQTEAERWYQAAAQNDNAEVAKLAQEALSEMH